MPLLCRQIQSSGSCARLLYSHVEGFLPSGSDISAGRGSKCFKTWTYASVQLVERWSSYDHTATGREAGESLELLACSSEAEEHHSSCFGRTEALCTGAIPIQLRHWRSALFRFGSVSLLYSEAHGNGFTLGVGLRQFSHSPLPSSESQKRVLPRWNGGIPHSRGTQDAGTWGISSRSHMGHAHDHSHGFDEKGGEKVLKLGFWADILLSVTKGVAGYISGSAAIIADAAHSVSDIGLSAVAWWASRAARAPSDKEHPYGHAKIETMGALCISSLLLATGGGIAWHAIEALQVLLSATSSTHMDTLVQAATDTIQNHSHSQNHDHGGLGHHHGLDMEHPEVALSAAIVSIGLKEGLYWITRSEGEKQGSALLKANAWHHRSDAISSVVALIGVGGTMVGIRLLDPLAALLVAGMIAKAGVETGYQSIQELLDMGLPESVLGPVRKTVLEVEGVEGLHQLRGRRMGSTIHLDVHIEVDPWLSVSAAHNIGEAVRQQVHKNHPHVTESFVHIDPADGGPADLTQAELEMEFNETDKHVHDHSNPPDRPSYQLHHNSVRVKGGQKDEHLHLKRDLTRTGSKADILESNSTSPKEAPGVFGDHVQTLRQSEVEHAVRCVLDANFHKAATVKHVTCHFLRCKVVVEVGVSLDPDLAIRDAMQRAKDIEACLLQNVPDISTVSSCCRPKRHHSTLVEGREFVFDGLLQERLMLLLVQV